MRAPFRGNSRWLLPALLLFVALCLTGVAAAQTLEQKYEEAQGKLSKVRQSESAVAATLAEQNAAIDSMIGEVSALRQRQAALEAELAEKQAELDRATAKLEAEKRRLARIRERLQRALDVLRERLITIYETGSPDMLSAVLDSANWSEATARAGYLSQIQEYDNAVASRVKALRDQAREAVERMKAIRLQLEEARDTIAVKEREAAEAKAAAEARFAELKAAQAERQRTLDSLSSRSAALSDNLADPGPERRLHLRKPGQHPQRRAARRAGGDRSGQRDRYHPLRLGRRPRLL
jgi:chromosome segregation protein